MAINGMTGLGDFLARVRDELPALMSSGVLEAATVAAGEIRKVIFDRGISKMGGLARSFRPELIASTRSGASAQAASSLVYAGIQDRGGRILPRSGQALAVPVRPLPVGKWPRHFPKEGAGALHFIPRKGKAPLLARIKKRRGDVVSVEPVFVLLRSVKIKPKHYLRDAERIMGPIAEEILGDAAIESIDKVPD